jgi:molybdopterin molybdotransferase
MLEFDRAQALLAEAGTPPAASESCALDVAQGRVLAHDVAATLDMPPADNSSMDGYAIRAADYREGAIMPVQQRCYAGDMPAPLRAGWATRLFTGSLLPTGADTVILQEDSVESDEGVRFLETPTPGQFVRPRAEDVAAGAVLLTAGTVLGAAELALLAAQGMTDVAVRPRLRIGVLTTGDEIISPGRVSPGRASPGQPIQPQQIYNSNGPMLAALIEGMGATTSAVVHSGDDVESLRAALTRLAQCSDLVISAGGASVGDRDLVKPALESLGGELALWKVRMKPGKPVALGAVQGTPVVCLPGNPVSVFAVFTVLVSPMIRRMQGRLVIYPAVAGAVLRASKVHGDSREEFLRVQARHTTRGMLEVLPHPNQGSGIMSALPWATGLARIPAGSQRREGDVVSYYDFRLWLR